MSNQERTGDILEDMHLMDIDELRVEIEGLLEHNRYILVENWKEKEALRSRIKEYEAALKDSVKAIENVNDIVRPIHSAVVRWKLTSYTLVIICAYLCWVIYNGGAQ